MPTRRAGAEIATPTVRENATSESPPITGYAGAATSRRLARTVTWNYTFLRRRCCMTRVVPRPAMKFGIWTPLPHTIRPEPGMDRAIAQIKSGTNLAGRTDGTFELACEVVRRADELGFDTTLIAERFLGP